MSTARKYVASYAATGDENQSSSPPSTRTVSGTVAILYTQRTSLLIPKAVLSAGQAYVFKIHAWQVPGMNFAKTPFITGPTVAFADVISGLIQP